jgi:hypothetical protein
VRQAVESLLDAHARLVGRSVSRAWAQCEMKSLTSPVKVANMAIGRLVRASAIHASQLFKAH